jgi:hypothetical protein
MFQYRQVLARMRQGDSDRDIARARLMGRRKAAQLRLAAIEHEWLDPRRPLPDDAELAAAFAPAPLPATCVSSLEEQRERITKWTQAGISGTAIHAALVRQHGFEGSYSAVRRILQSIHAAEPPAATRRLLVPTSHSSCAIGVSSDLSGINLDACRGSSAIGNTGSGNGGGGIVAKCPSVVLQDMAIQNGGQYCCRSRRCLHPIRPQPSAINILTKYQAYQRKQQLVKNPLL